MNFSARQWKWFGLKLVVHVRQYQFERFGSAAGCEAAHRLRLRRQM